MSSISVIIPSYNRATIIADTISNMLAQSTPPMEVIVVDDGSTDDSVDVIKAFGERVQLITQTNQGPGAARNAGLKRAKGEFIQFMDSDDLASNNKFQVQLQALQTTGADFAYCPWVSCMIDNGTIRFVGDVLQAHPVPASKPMLEWFVSGWSLVFQNCLFRRSALDRAGSYRTDLMPSEDSEYFVRILLAGAVPVHTDECLVFYREHNINKITSTGTSAIHRAQDWTKYLMITGGLLAQRMSGFSMSTKIAIATNVSSHLKHCLTHGLHLLPADHPYLSMVVPFRPVTVPFYRFYQKALRKITGSAHFHTAFRSQTPGQKHHELARGIGFKTS